MQRLTVSALEFPSQSCFAKEIQGTNAKILEASTAREGTRWSLVFPSQARTRTYHGWPLPPSRVLVKPKKVRDAIKRLVLAQVSAVKTKNTLTALLRPLFPRISVAMTKAELDEGDVEQEPSALLAFVESRASLLPKL